ncbi:MAG: ComF family protein [Candidatus Margulisbacteria bacterium]|nr:ComF family protein [Candidatus Margulisiibacteriota bacterium]
MAKFTLFAKILNTLLPNMCEICHSFCDQEICDSCLKTLPIHPKIKSIPPLTNIHSLCRYEDPIKHLLSRIKFDGQKHIASHLSTLLKRHIPSQTLKNIDVIIPVPLHSARYKKRGFNQVDLLFQPLAKATHIPYHNHILSRIKATPPLFNLDKEQRPIILQDAFCIHHPKVILGKNVMIVDDIYTTGSTLNACGRLLKKKGAKSVQGMTLCEVK